MLFIIVLILVLFINILSFYFSNRIQRINLDLSDDFGVPNGFSRQERLTSIRLYPTHPSTLHAMKKQLFGTFLAKSTRR